MKRRIFGIALGMLMLSGVNAQIENFHLVAGQDAAEDSWVEKTFNSLTPDERLGQLFMIRAHSNLGADHIASVEAQIKRYKVGGMTCQSSH